MPLSFIDSPSGPTKPSSLLGVAISLPLLCIIAIVLRFNLRRTQKWQMKLDDWVLLPALIFVVGMGIIVILGVERKVWGYLSSVETSDSANILEGVLLEIFTYVQIFALAAIKFSALFFYHRVFENKSHRHNTFDIAKIVLMAIVGLWTIAMILMNSLQCGTHISALWSGLEDYDIYCGVISPVYQEASALSNVLLDVSILALPLPKIFGLHTTASRKFGISVIFLLASIGLGASIARTDAIFEIVLGLVSPDADVRLADSLQVFWSMLEAGISLFAVNLPSLWAYRTHVSPNRIIASIRSAISLRSMTSSRSRGTNTYTRSPAMQVLSGDIQSLKSSSSDARFVPRVSGQKSETYAMYDVEAQRNAYPMPEGVIIVNSSVSQKGNKS